MPLHYTYSKSVRHWTDRGSVEGFREVTIEAAAGGRAGGCHTSSCSLCRYVECVHRALLLLLLLFYDKSFPICVRF